MASQNGAQPEGQPQNAILLYPPGQQKQLPNNIQEMLKDQPKGGPWKGPLQITPGQVGSSFGDMVGNAAPTPAQIGDQPRGVRDQVMLQKDPANILSAGKQQTQVMAGRIGDLWGGLSPAQKSLSLSALTESVIQDRTGRRIQDHVVPGTENSINGALTVGNAMGATVRGQNGHALARNWGELSAFSTMAGAGRDVMSTAKVAEHTGLMGFGPQGAAVKLDPGYLKAVGAQPAPEYGVGAAVFGQTETIPTSYKVLSVTPDGLGVIAIPQNLAQTSLLSTAGPKPLAAQKAREIAQRTHPAMQLWGEPDTRVVRGSAGGSAMISGLNIMAKANPHLAGSMIAYSLFNNTMGD